VNKLFRFPIEEIDETIENRRQVKMKHFDLDIERRSLVEKMESSQEYKDMRKVDELMMALSDEDAYIIKERYQYGKSFRGIGVAINYSDVQVFRMVNGILGKLLPKITR